MTQHRPEAHREVSVAGTAGARKGRRASSPPASRCARARILDSHRRAGGWRLASDGRGAPPAGAQGQWAARPGATDPEEAM